MKTDFSNESEFYSFLMNEVRAEARIEDEEKLTEVVYVEKMLDYLHESNFLENGVPCNHNSRDYKIDAYDMNATENSVDILVSCFKDDSNELIKIRKADIERSFKKAKKFLDDSRINKCTGKLDGSAEASDLATLIHNNFKNLKRSRIILLTNGVTGAYPSTTDVSGDFEISYQIWDFNRLWRQVSSGMKKEFISVEFLEEGYEPLSCVYAEDGRGFYTTYISIIPGQLLRDLYDRYGTRLLERNVRAFLQARSNVNRGIRDTIIDNPHMFLAFNNGITVTANSASFITDETGTTRITRINDFQVVNGGQTVASLWHTSVRNKAPLNNIFIQMKLTVINKPENIDIIAPKISEYSNAQNKVNTADFSANDPFHINLEAISQTIWAPDPTGGNDQSMWYYERSRGSYAESIAQKRTPANKKKWEKINPRSQKFDKIMVAKLENSWRQLPHIVSLGGQKNFSHFMVFVREKIEAKSEINVDKNYFNDLISKLILWKNMEKIIRKQGIAGYRANIITYTIGWILRNKPELINLDKIWSSQRISEELSGTIDSITRHIRNIITNVDGNVTEWCKKVDCWNKIKDKELDLTHQVETFSKTAASIPNKFAIDFADYTDNLDLWINLLKWNELNSTLSLWEIDFCGSIKNIIEKKDAPSFPQIQKAEKVLKKSFKNGFEKGKDY